jgi:hypothetical protein
LKQAVNLASNVLVSALVERFNGIEKTPLSTSEPAENDRHLAPGSENPGSSKGLGSKLPGLSHSSTIERFAAPNCARAHIGPSTMKILPSACWLFMEPIEKA